jgi:hypothetical protein
MEGGRVLLYLDQSHLSNVAKRRPELEAERTRLLELIATGKAQLVLSLYHLLETIECKKQGGKLERDILAFIDDMSPGAVWILPIGLIFTEEAKRAFKDFLGFPQVHPVEVFARNLQDFVRRNFDDPFLLWGEERSPSYVASLLRAQRAGKNMKASGQAVVQNVLKYRDHVLSTSNDEWSRRRQLLEFVPVVLDQGVVPDRLKRQEFAQHVSFDDLPAFGLFQDAKDAIVGESFKWNLPREPQAGDYSDLHHMVALPYVDFFTCDNYCWSRLNQIKRSRVGRGTAVRTLQEALERI